VQGLELWGGHECTVSRVGDVFRDQTILSGHQERVDDLDRFAAFGLRTLRYPLLWERVAPDRPDVCDWHWIDTRLTRMCALGLRPIAGLCHHGSGPAYVNLLSPEFAPGLAAHAERAARRYPWIDAWTPVNEPLTTARFSALYGHWYPHHKDERSFWLALLNQIDAIRLAMKAIRKHNPRARLIQTEDLGRTYATAALTDQADFDNTRRWMTWDLLFGRVNAEHPMWSRLSAMGFGDRLRAIAAEPCPPDVIGVNHYLTSDRFLDHRCARYPGVAAGGNGVMHYVDVEAVRVISPRPAGVAGALREAWARYGATLAITEAHNACTRDEQVRWFANAWRDALRLREEGIEIEAVTSWSLLGAYDWNSLLTRANNHYEPGAFDVSGGVPRPTALAHYLKALSKNEQAPAPISGAGWWERDIRHVHRPVRTPQPGARVHRARRAAQRPILILGARGTLGQALTRACQERNLPCAAATRAEVQLESRTSIEAAIAKHQPVAVINAAGWVRVDEAEQEIDACRRVNTEGAALLVRICADRALPSVTFSTDLVFDGANSAPYSEGATPNPLNVYGASKADAEAEISATCARALIIRTAAFFSTHDPYNFAAWVVREVGAGRTVECASDAVVSPTFVPSLAHAALDLLLDGEAGIWHLANRGAVTWAEFARRIARACKLNPALVRDRVRAELGWPAPRPANSALTSTRGALLPDLDESIWRFGARVSELTSLAP
jgi:dTDP-4-dehydrorhamnose reductase